MLCVGCSGTDTPSTAPGTRGPPGITLGVGSAATDTITTPLATPLTITVRAPDGTPAVGAVVRFEALGPLDPTRGNVAAWVCAESRAICPDYPQGSPIDHFAYDTVDAAGKARIRVRLGRTAGRSVVRITIPELALEDSAIYVVRPGAIAGVRALSADTAVTIGGTRTLQGGVVDRYGNARDEPATWSTAAGSVLSLNASTGVVAGLDMGAQRVYVRYQTFTDSTFVRVVPAGRLAVWSPATNAILLVDTDGGTARSVVAANTNDDFGAFPRFDATRQRLSFMTAAGISARDVPLSAIVDVDTLGAVRRSVGTGGELSSVLVSRRVASGSFLAVGSRIVNDLASALSVVRIADDGTVSDLAVLPGAEGCYGCADISPDGSRIAYLAGQGFRTLRELRVLTVATGQVVSVSPDASSPRWSPRGDRLAWLAPARPGETLNEFDGRLVTANADGSGTQSYVSAGLFSPGISWSPDERYVVARTVSGAGFTVIRLADGNTVGLRYRDRARPVTSYYQPDWR